MLKLCSEDFSQLRVHALYDGDEIAPWETAMTVEGDYSLFARLETVYLGVLSRRTKVATNVRRVVEAANGKQIIFFPARHDHHLVQTGDGYAAHVSGAIGVSTDAQASWWGGKGVGTVPHALIATYGGDTVLAARKYAEYVDPSVNLVVLVDFENDSVRTSLEVARALGTRLWGVRLDTSETMVDQSVQQIMGDFDPRGVNAQLCRLVRRALDREGFERVKIVASGGFNVQKIERFEREQVPVDAYGGGSGFFQGWFEVFALHCVPGTHEAEVVDALQDLVLRGHLIRKRRYSGFFETDLEDRLRRLAPQTVTVVGVCTDICVMHTVADLRNRDYQVVVVREGVETFDGPGHPHDSVQEFALAHLDRKSTRL